MDLIEDFAFRLPVTIICDMLGIPQDHREVFHAGSRDGGRLLDPVPLHLEHGELPPVLTESLARGRDVPQPGHDEAGQRLVRAVGQAEPGQLGQLVGAQDPVDHPYPVGMRIGHSVRHNADSLREPFAVMQAALLGFMGLVLAFGLSLAVQRYEDRRAAVVVEANAIGTTYLRAQTLPEPERTVQEHSAPETDVGERPTRPTTPDPEDATRHEPDTHGGSMPPAEHTGPTHPPGPAGAKTKDAP